MKAIARVRLPASRAGLEKASIEPGQNSGPDCAANALERITLQRDRRGAKVTCPGPFPPMRPSCSRWPGFIRMGATAQRPSPFYTSFHASAAARARCHDQPRMSCTISCRPDVTAACALTEEASSRPAEGDQADETGSDHGQNQRARLRHDRTGHQVRALRRAERERRGSNGGARGDT
jgi:hypothetical protein